MSITIHPTAIVSKKAKIGDDVTIGPYAIVDADVTIGKATKIYSHCVIQSNTTIGAGCEIFTGAVIGSRPQDLKYKGARSFLEIGNNNIIREYCTLNPGTDEGSKTVVGNDNLLMAYSHIAHNCTIENNCILANGSTLAGHVTIQDGAVISGLVAIHQFVRIGKLSITGGCSKIVQDIPPFSTCDGHPAEIYGLNLVGLRRNKFSQSAIEKLRHTFGILFFSGLTIRHGLENLEKEAPYSKEVAYLVDFVKNSQRGISRSCRLKT
jgi:UDP-N-acetylglucosamine acyltransferase